MLIEIKNITETRYHSWSTAFCPLTSVIPRASFSFDSAKVAQFAFDNDAALVGTPLTPALLTDVTLELVSILHAVRNNPAFRKQEQRRFFIG